MSTSAARCSSMIVRSLYFTGKIAIAYSTFQGVKTMRL